jgi:hypothetical protein
VALLLSLCVAAGGCGGDALYPVKGRVVDETGLPCRDLAGYRVVFEPEEGGAHAEGEIKEDGTFSLTTRQADDGARAGKHKVQIARGVVAGDRPAILPERYGQFSSSGLTATVEAKQDNDITLPVSRVRKK